jgi:hypothetical protein
LKKSNEKPALGPTRASVYLGSNPKSGFSTAIALSRQTREAEQEREREKERDREGGITGGVERRALGTFEFSSTHGAADTKLWMKAVQQHLLAIRQEVCFVFVCLFDCLLFIYHYYFLFYFILFIIYLIYLF